ncbi:MAG: hypothetical protein K8T20_05970 [Planctomycetes bacterium]|nr:hypothetical protein [Planctomycetota bacterium]
MQSRALTSYFVLLLLALAFAGARAAIRQDEAPAALLPESPLPAGVTAPVPDEPPAEHVPYAGTRRARPVARHEGCGAAPCESTTSVGLKAMLRAQNPDGSWGGEAEMFDGHIHTQVTATSLTLLTLLSAGYTHLNLQKTSDGLCFGTAVKGALKWLMACQPADAYESSLVALALSESYALTMSPLLKQAAQDSVDRLADWQRYDSTRNDPAAEAWAATAVSAARMGELEYDAESADRARARLSDQLDSSPGATSATGWIFLSRDPNHAGLAHAATAIAASLPDWEHPDFSGWYFGTLALYQIEGPPRDGGTGENWKAWSEALKQALIVNQQRDGTWPGVSGPTGARWA